MREDAERSWERNIQALVDRMTRDLGLLTALPMSFLGRSAIFKTLDLPRLLYQLLIIP